MRQMTNCKCKLCDVRIRNVNHYVSHLEQSHSDQLFEDQDGYRYLYFLQTGKVKGSCVVCKKPTTWNPKTMKYNRYCSEGCKEKYREIFANRMIGRYGKVTLLNDPEQQKMMLSKRRISGEYQWSDHVHVKSYTGSYEHSFIEFLDVVMNYEPEDVITPSPHTYHYEYEGQRHFYIPDVYIASLNLEVEIKDGGDNPNLHHKIQDVDKVKEQLKDEVMRTNGAINYIKIVNKENRRFFEMLDRLKENYLVNDTKPVIIL